MNGRELRQEKTPRETQGADQESKQYLNSWKNQRFFTKKFSNTDLRQQIKYRF
jgi:hypothetical protein